MGRSARERNICGFSLKLKVSNGIPQKPFSPAPLQKRTSFWRAVARSLNSNARMFTGTYTAIVTPFKNGKVDESALARLIKAQLKGGVDGIVPVGTTGESPTLSYEEHKAVVGFTVQAVAGKAKVLAGTGANSTEEAVYLTKAAEHAGADGSLQVAPYYNKPTQEGLYQHFRAIAESTKLPIVLYSIPGRCGIEIGIETVKRLARDCKNIVGIKEAGGVPDRVSQIRAACGPKFVILSGDDSLTLPFMAVGADGVISVASNVIPREVSNMVRAFASGNPAAALKIHAKFFPLFRNLFVEANPGPAKAALAMLGMMEPDLRLPLVRLGSKNHDLVHATLRECGILK
jgi:4-hydroxy-tetrahydrodipicolinate synthase